MKNKVSSIALLLTLTACGGGNSPVSTLPSSTKPTTQLSVAEQRAASQKVFSVKSDNLTSIISKAEENIGNEIDISNYDAIETAYKTAISSPEETNRSASSRKVNRSSVSSSGLIVANSGEKLTDIEKGFNILTMTSKLFEKGISIISKFNDALKSQGKEEVAKNTLIQGIKAFEMGNIIDVSNTEISMDELIENIDKTVDDIKTIVQEKMNGDFKKADVDFSKYKLENMSFLTDENNTVTGIRLTNDMDEDYAKSYNPEDKDRTKYKSTIYTDFNLSDFKEVNGIQTALNRKTYTFANIVLLSKDGKFQEVHEIPAFASDENGNYTGKAEFNADNLWETFQVLTNEEFSDYLVDLRNGDYGEKGLEAWEKVKKITKEDIAEAIAENKSIDIGNGFALSFIDNYKLKIDTEIGLAGNTVDLSYSQFGNITIQNTFASDVFEKYGIKNGDDVGSESYAFAGGNSDYKIDINNISDDITFKGKAFGGVTLGSNQDEGVFDEAIDISGSVVLSLTPNENIQEKLVADFDDSYTITVTKQKGGAKEAIIDDKNIIDQDMRVGRYNSLEKADFQYFGNNGNPEEAVGVVRIEGRNASDARDLDIRFSFGAKK